MKNLRIRLLTLSKRSCLSLWTNKTRQSIDLHRNNLSMDVGVRDQRFDDYRFSSSYRENYKYGPFYRSRSKTQTLDVDLLMMSSGLAYGTTSSSGDFIQVEAYRGAIPPGDQGIEFFTNTEPGGIEEPLIDTLGW
ncbi:hypothetical protein GOB82_12555 [Acetobacter farinalis]|nr:hypothetical protein [Acetobacter farinalis]